MVLVQWCRSHRLFLLALAAAVAGLAAYAHHRVQRLVYPAIPARMARPKVELPKNIELLGSLILKQFEHELVPSGDGPLAIEDVQPRRGAPGTRVTVKGRGFGDAQGNSAVMVNLTEAVARLEVLAWSDTEIVFTVPEQSTSGEVAVMRWDHLRTEQSPKGFFRQVAKNPVASNGIPFEVLGQEELIALGKSIFFGWTQLNEEASSLLRIPRAKIATDPQKWEKYGFLPRSELLQLDEGEADRLSRPTPIVGVRMQHGLDDETRVGYSCAFCHTGRDPATGKITPGLPSSTLQFGKLIATAPNLPEDMRKQAIAWPPGTSDLSFRYFPDGVENPAAIMQARGMHGMRFWNTSGLPMPEYQRHSNAWLMQGSPYMAPMKVSLALCVYLSTLKPIKNPNVDRAAAERGKAVFEAQKCHLCHVPALGLYTNQRTFPFEIVGSNGPPTQRMVDTGGIRVTPLPSVYATAPYLHDHSVKTLDELLDPARLAPGSPIYKKPHTPGPAHPWVVTDPKQRADLVTFLESL